MTAFFSAFSLDIARYVFEKSYKKNAHHKN